MRAETVPDAVGVRGGHMGCASIGALRRVVCRPPQTMLPPKQEKVL